jgi:hypothetical protein
LSSLKVIADDGGVSGIAPATGWLQEIGTKGTELAQSSLCDSAAAPNNCFHVTLILFYAAASNFGAQRLIFIDNQSDGAGIERFCENIE